MPVAHFSFLLSKEYLSLHLYGPSLMPMIYLFSSPVESIFTLSLRVHPWCLWHIFTFLSTTSFFSLVETFSHFIYKVHPWCQWHISSPIKYFFSLSRASFLFFSGSIPDAQCSSSLSPIMEIILLIPSNIPFFDALVGLFCSNQCQYVHCTLS